MPQRDGIDVSHFQNQAGGSGPNAIKWPKVKSDGAKFCIVKISDKTSADAFGAANLKNARNAGLLVGGYHFMRNTASGAAQAEAFLGGVELKQGDLVPTLDLEIVPSTVEARKALVVKSLDWITAVSEKIGGKRPFIYTRRDVIMALGNPAEFKTCPLWLARFGSTAPPVPPGYPGFVIWQFSDKGSIDGITGNVDEDTLNISFEKLKSDFTI